MSRVMTAVGLLALLLANACGGGHDGSAATGPTGNPTGNPTVSGDGAITATVNGTAWRSAKAADRATRTGTFIGISTFNVPYALVLTVGNAAVGTFSLSPATGTGSSAIMSNSAGGWGTGFAGGSGTITVTVLTATRIAGTFSFDAMPGSGAATGTLQVRNGVFDVSF